MQVANKNERDLLQCMEVRGGHGDAANYFSRPGLDVWIWSQARQDPKSEGGDMHYITSCASGRITRMLMADVGGIDNLFADVAGRARDLLKRNINVIAQGPAMQQLSADMSSTTKRGGFASTLLSTFFAPTRSLTICNTGHPPPLLYRSASQEWSAIKSDAQESLPAMDFSGTADPLEYQRLKLKLEVGDLILYYSNALAECRQADGRTLGVLGLQKFARRLTPASMSANTLNEFVADIKAEHEGNLRDQDATVILCKATRTHVAMRDNFLAPFRLLRGVNDRTTF